MRIFQSPHNENGSVMVEASFVLVLFFLFSLGYIEAARYIAAKNMLKAATDRTLEIAERVSDLENTDTQANIEKDAINFATVTLVSKAGTSTSAVLKDPEVDNYKILTLPEYSPGNLESELQKTPIAIQLRASITPLVPFLPPIHISAQSVGYREPYRVATNPVPEDCGGSVLGTPDYKPWKACPCTDFQCPGFGQTSWAFNTWVGGDVGYQSGCMCVCDYSKGFTTDGEGGPCICSPGKTLRNNMCDDDSSYCPAGQRYSSNTGKCECGAGATANADNACLCSNPKKNYDNTKYTCTCAPAPADQSLLDGANCVYGCLDPTNAIGPDGTCSACKSGYTHMEATTHCYCINDPMLVGATCPAGSTFDTATCKCLCDDACIDAHGNSNHYPPDSGGSCASCPTCGPNEIQNGRSCGCDASACTIPLQLPDSYNQCACTCSAGTRMYNGQCLQGNCVSVLQSGCNAGIIWGSGGSCSCDE